MSQMKQARTFCEKARARHIELNHRAPQLCSVFKRDGHRMQSSHVQMLLSDPIFFSLSLRSASSPTTHQPTCTFPKPTPSLNHKDMPSYQNTLR